MRDRPRVGEILLEAGIIDEMQLAAALGEQTRWGRRLGMTLVKLGMVQEGQLVRALARQFDMPVASLAGKKIAPEVIALVPARVAIDHTVIPLFTKKDGPKGQLFLGMEDPSDLGVLDDLAFRTGMAIRPVMVGPTELGEAIDRYYNARPAPSSSTLPDALRASDTLTETHLRRPEAAPTLAELLKPGPPAPDTAQPTTALPSAAKADATVSLSSAPTPAARVERLAACVEAIDATPLLPVTPDVDPEVEPTGPVAEPEARPEPASVALPTPASVPTPEPLELDAPEAVAPPPVPPPAAVAPAPLASSDAAPAAPDIDRASAPPVVQPAADRLAHDVARAVEETERTRLVAKAIAHLLIEKGVLTYEELHARIDKLKPSRPGASD
ncbi:MAG: hypothetical protein R3F35_14220 [Myxococcota bacterium]